MQNSNFPPLASGQLDAWVAVTSPANHAVEELLPDGFALAEQTLAPAGMHPLIILAGYQKNVRSRFNDDFRMNYLEAGVMIPYVRHANGYQGDTSLFRASLYLDQRLPIMLGRLLGITKTVGKMARDQSGMVVATSTDQPVFHAQFFSHGTFSYGRDLPWMAEVRRLFGQVHVGHAMVTDSMPLVRVACDLDFQQGYARSVSAELELTDAFCPAVPRKLVVPSIEQGPFGAFQISSPWSLRCLAWADDNGGPGR